MCERHIEHSKDAVQEALDYGIIHIGSWQDDTSGTETAKTF